MYWIWCFKLNKRRKKTLLPTLVRCVWVEYKHHFAILLILMNRLVDYQCNPIVGPDRPSRIEANWKIVNKMRCEIRQIGNSNWFQSENNIWASLTHLKFGFILFLFEKVLNLFGCGGHYGAGFIVVGGWLAFIFGACVRWAISTLPPTISALRFLLMYLQRYE